MGMYATSANQLRVDFGPDRFLTFKMHATLSIDVIRMLARQVKRIETITKRADRIDESAIEAPDTDDEQFRKLTANAEALREQGGDQLGQLQLCVDYIMQASLGWLDFFEDAEAEKRNEPLPFTAQNVMRLGVVNVGKIMNSFNLHYGLQEESKPGEARSESLPEPSQLVAKAHGPSPTGISSNAPTA